MKRLVGEVALWIAAGLARVALLCGVGEVESDSVVVKLSSNGHNEAEIIRTKE